MAATICYPEVDLLPPPPPLANMILLKRETSRGYSVLRLLEGFMAESMPSWIPTRDSEMWRTTDFLYFIRMTNPEVGE